MRRRSYRYQFSTYNASGYAVAEAYVNGDSLPSYTIKVPMGRLYAKEVSYILDCEEWDATAKDLTYSKVFDHNEFLAGDTPLLVSWWVSSLPNTTSYFKMRRKNWKRQLQRRLEKLWSELVDRFTTFLNRW